jgi:formylglycine-generating enzyme required for sulfatase activity
MTCLLISLALLCFFTAHSPHAEEWIEPEMVEIPAGEFLYGSSPDERDTYIAQPHEIPIHTATTAAYRIGKFEVTNNEYACFVHDNGYEKKENWSPQGWAFKEKFKWTQPRRWLDRDYTRQGTQPVCAVSWFEAQAYANWLASKTGKPYRLPTEKEWEKAARGMNGNVFPWGNEWNPAYCNWENNALKEKTPHSQKKGFHFTCPVDSFAEGVSPYGCYQMAGNVMEWCDSTLSVRSQTYVVYRGGSFYSGYPRFFRCAWRGGTRPEYGHIYWGRFGFRLAMDQTE